MCAISAIHFHFTRNEANGQKPTEWGLSKCAGTVQYSQPFTININNFISSIEYNDNDVEGKCVHVYMCMCVCMCVYVCALNCGGRVKYVQGFFF